MAELTISLGDALAREMQQESPGGEEFRRLLISVNLHLTALHPGTTDPELVRWFSATLSEDADVERTLERLRGHPGVVAAYVKPPDEAP